MIIVGAGGHGQVVANLLLTMQDAGMELVPIGYLDDNPELLGQLFLDLPVTGGLERLSVTGHEAVIIGIGDNKIRQRVYENLQYQGEQFITACHTQSSIARNVSIGPGSVVCAGAIIKTGTKLGANVIINSGSGVGHHNLIEDHVHIGPGVRLGAHVTVCEGALLGIGATVIPGRTIGHWSIVGAGAVVIRDVTAGSTVAGVPAKPLS